MSEKLNQIVSYVVVAVTAVVVSLGIYCLLNRSWKKDFGEKPKTSQQESENNLFQQVISGGDDELSETGNEEQAKNINGGSKNMKSGFSSLRSNKGGTQSGNDHRLDISSLGGLPKFRSNDENQSSLSNQGKSGKNEKQNSSALSPSKQGGLGSYLRTVNN